MTSKKSATPGNFIATAAPNPTAKSRAPAPHQVPKPPTESSMPLSPTAHATPAQNIKAQQKIVIPSATSKLANKTKTCHSERSEESAFRSVHALPAERTQ